MTPRCGETLALGAPASGGVLTFDPARRMVSWSARNSVLPFPLFFTSSVRSALAEPGFFRSGCTRNDVTEMSRFDTVAVVTRVVSGSGEEETPDDELLSPAEVNGRWLGMFNAESTKYRATQT